MVNVGKYIIYGSYGGFLKQPVSDFPTRKVYLRRKFRGGTKLPHGSVPTEATGDDDVGNGYQGPMRVQPR